MSAGLEGFVDGVCEQRRVIRWMFMLATFLLVVSLMLFAIGFLTDEATTPFLVVMTMNAVGFAAFSGGSLLTLRYCRRRRRRKRGKN